MKNKAEDKDNLYSVAHNREVGAILKLKMKTRPSREAEIIKSAKFLREKVPLIKYHHERFDGKQFDHKIVNTFLEVLQNEGKISAIEKLGK